MNERLRRRLELRRSNAAQPHTPKRDKGTRKERKRKAIEDSQQT
ncbi:hypothetical protein HOT82_gp133 [Gordonia phage Ronaldo]|uniref:Uncharacterized protein n=3 Tax=Ronaldovirus ronaldo TaxID=2734270 RepID=A0A6B9LGN0_9CAUD|nr:hypothetical protein HOT82_gp133 [Gordonia phage Ronaldo]AXN53698.1 hypothetical protein SEA_RONALDO_142 [Gordonia phage Ronaldo]QDH48480.1 hypothetical protein SEA_ZIKO_144 [Gordonia phage Ziko]QHB38255.1 hypothetical protein SEA_VOLT_145 [Gordonia phage Volt]